MSSGEWLAWSRFDLDQLQVSAESLGLAHHLPPLLWALAITAFGFIVLSFDTRDLRRDQRISGNIRDRILGIEQRYFIAIFNGLILYGALLYMLQNGEVGKGFNRK